MDKSLAQRCAILAAVALCMATHLRAEPRIDFNGDGYADLAVGVPDEDDAKATDAGAVNIIYGSASGLTEIGNAFITQRTKGVPGNRQKGAKFGKALAAGDFDGDGFTDLAVGAPFFDQPHLRDAGYVVIFDGADKGLSGSRANGLIWLDSMARNSNFGAALAAGDFDADGIDDIAVGAPEFWRIKRLRLDGPWRRVGLAWIAFRYGQNAALEARRGRAWRDERSTVINSARHSSQPISMATEPTISRWGPGEETSDYVPIGAVSVLFGQAGRAHPAGNEIWTQISDGGETPRRGTDTRIAWEAGTSNGDGCDELVVGALGDHSVHVIYGRAKG
jgi:hypothetical protein